MKRRGVAHRRRRELARRAKLTDLVRGVGKAAGGEEKVGLVLALARLGGLEQAGVRGLGVSAAHHLGHLRLDLQLSDPHFFTTLRRRRKTREIYVSTNFDGPFRDHSTLSGSLTILTCSRPGMAGCGRRPPGKP